MDEKRSSRTRLVIEPVPESVKSKRIMNLDKTARKKGYKISNRARVLQGFNLFISNAPNQLLPAEMFRPVYSLRWQIELVFKTWKSLWKIDKVKKVKKERLECYIYSKLFIIVLSLNMLWITHNLMRGLYGKNLSFYKALKTWIRSLSRFIEAFFNGMEAVTNYLKKFLELSCRKHLLMAS